MYAHVCVRPLYVLHRKHVHSSCLCVGARSEMESITSFPGKRAEERRASPGNVGAGMYNQQQAVHGS